MTPSDTRSIVFVITPWKVIRRVALLVLCAGSIAVFAVLITKATNFNSCSPDAESHCNASAPDVEYDTVCNATASWRYEQLINDASTTSVFLNAFRLKCTEVECNITVGGQTADVIIPLLEGYELKSGATIANSVLSTNMVYDLVYDGVDRIASDDERFPFSIVKTLKDFICTTDCSPCELRIYLDSLGFDAEMGQGAECNSVAENIQQTMLNLQNSDFEFLGISSQLRQLSEATDPYSTAIVTETSKTHNVGIYDPRCVNPSLGSNAYCGFGAFPDCPTSPSDPSYDPNHICVGCDVMYRFVTNFQNKQTALPTTPRYCGSTGPLYRCMMAYQQCAHNINTNVHNNKAFSFYVAGVEDSDGSKSQFYAYLRYLTDANGNALAIDTNEPNGPAAYDPSQTTTASPDIYSYVAYNERTARNETCVSLNATHCRLLAPNSRLEEMKQVEIVLKLACPVGCTPGDTYLWKSKRMATLCNAGGSTDVAFNWFNVFCRNCDNPSEDVQAIRDRPCCEKDSEFYSTFSTSSGQSSITVTSMSFEGSSERRLLSQRRRLSNGPNRIRSITSTPPPAPPPPPRTQWYPQNSPGRSCRTGTVPCCNIETTGAIRLIGSFRAYRICDYECRYRTRTEHTCSVLISNSCFCGTMLISS